MIGSILRCGLVAILGALLASPLRADTLSDFYKGKVISFYVGSDPGGSFGPYAQILADHMPKHIPGNPKIILKYTGGQ